jgi:hypothetical protein
VALLAMASCGTGTDRSALPSSTTTPADRTDVPEGYRCTDEDARALAKVLDARVLDPIGVARRSEAECAAGEWTWNAAGLVSDLDPGAAIAAVDERLQDISERQSLRSPGDQVWFGPCSATLDCRIDVVAVPTATGSDVTVRANAHHVDHTADRVLTGREFASAGIAEIVSAPESDYCAHAVAVIQGPGSGRAPRSFLTTQGPEYRSCDTVPVAFTFTAPQQSVTVEFWGAATNYALRGYDAEGHPVAEAFEAAAPYDYARSFRVAITAEGPTIARVTFGYEAAVTQVLAITFGAADGTSKEVRFDGRPANA